MKFISIAAATVLATSAESRLQAANEERDLVTAHDAEVWNSEHGGTEMHTQEYSTEELVTMEHAHILETETENVDLSEKNVLVEGEAGYMGGNMDMLPRAEQLAPLIELDQEATALREHAEAVEEELQDHTSALASAYNIEGSGR
mmetsp:Transcript_27543/g.41674  ORF Transcript_27543/g.41674 Transcript_27543/m.41674 type:complete len:145 (+) Transcript_27543:22-456(+)